MTNLEWRLNDDLDRWELGYPLIYSPGMNVVSWIRCEVIDEFKDTPQFAKLVKEKFGSCPPPLQYKNEMKEKNDGTASRR